MNYLNKPIIKIAIQFIFFELLFLFLLNLGFTFLPHQDIETIYYFQVNLYYLIACFSFLNLLQSKINRFIIFLFFSFSTYVTVATLFLFFGWTSGEIDNNYYFYYIYYHIINNTLMFFISSFLFFYILQPYKNIEKNLILTFILTCAVSGTIYIAFMFSFDVISHFYYFMNSTNNLLFWINFIILLMFWNEFIKQKHNLSEYIITILIIYTISIGLEIVHIFLIKNDIIIHKLSQYFTAVLNILMLITWIIRLYYLHSPQAKENEYYISNYNVLYGLVEKPRIGFFEKIYHKIDRKVIWAFLITVGVGSSSLFIFNQFNLFVSKNIFLLLFALIVTIFFAVLYWDKKWFQGIEFLIKKKE